MKAHFIGIAGVGMGSTALLLRERGWEVSGSDLGFYPPMSTYLSEKKVHFSHGYKKEHIPTDADIIVIGKSGRLTPETNEEVRAAFDSGKRIVHFAELLGQLAEQTQNIVVAGSHGKSTCTALIAWCLHHAGKSPHYFFGAVTSGAFPNAQTGTGTIFVLEGDEYPSSNWDDSSKFLHYHAHDILITSTMHDHVNVFKTHEAYLMPFKKLVSQIPNDGILVVCSDDESNREHFNLKHAITYGLSGDPDWYACNISYGSETTFTLQHNRKPIVDLKTKLLGAHNIQNIVGVSALLLEKKMLSIDELRDGIASFPGLTRRLDLKTTHSTIPVYEGFGSSYSKARAGIDALKVHFPGKRLIVVFEPHTFSWRNRAYLDQYRTVFNDVDSVYIFHEEEKRMIDSQQVSLNEILEKVRGCGTETYSAMNASELLKQLLPQLCGNEIILIETSGDMGGLVKKIPTEIERRFS